MEMRLLRLLAKVVLFWQQAGRMLSGRQLAVLLQRALGRGLEWTVNGRWFSPWIRLFLREGRDMVLQVM